MDRKCIFITGAASGIGLETAKLFANKGWFVGIFDVNEKGLKSLQNEIGADNSCMKVMDVADLKSVQEAVDAFSERTGGRMDVLLNNAGILKMGPNTEISIEDQKLTIDINFMGVLNCNHCAMPLLEKTPDARIISMSSASAFYGVPELAVYSATKHAVSAMTEALNIELEGKDIYVCDIQPPYVKTPLIYDADHQAASVEKMGVNITPEQVAQVAWKAAHGKKLHWKVGAALHISAFFFWLLPFARHSMMKKLTME